MERIQIWASNLCAAAIGCFILQMIAPKKGTGKLFQLLTSLFFVCCFVTPLLSIHRELPSFSEDLPTEIQDRLLLDQLNRQTEQAATTAIQTMAKSTLKSYGYDLEKVVLQTDTSQEGYIYITGITVYVDSKQAKHSTAIATLLRNRLEMEITVRATQ